MQTPDFTRAQLVAIVQAVIAVAVAFSVNLSSGQQYALVGLAAVIAGILIPSDVKLRGNRASNADKIAEAKAAAPPPAPRRRARKPS